MIAPDPFAALRRAVGPGAPSSDYDLTPALRPAGRALRGAAVLVAFEDAPGGTLVTMRAVFPTKERLDLVVREFGAVEGGHQHLARFNDYIRSIATGTASGR